MSWLRANPSGDAAGSNTFSGNGMRLLEHSAASAECQWAANVDPVATNCGAISVVIPNQCNSYEVTEGLRTVYSAVALTSFDHERTVFGKISGLRRAFQVAVGQVFEIAEFVVFQNG